MIRALCIDPGAALGWAIRITKTKVMYGTEDFKQFTGVDGRVHWKFYQWFDDFLRAAKPTHIVSEAPIFRGVNSEYLYGFHIIISMLCFRHNITPVRVHLATIKKSITGHGGADKEAMIAAVKRLGYSPETEHEADALGILIFHERNSERMGEFTGKTISLKPRTLNTIRRARKNKKTIRGLSG